MSLYFPPSAAPDAYLSLQNFLQCEATCKFSLALLKLLPYFYGQMLLYKVSSFGGGGGEHITLFDRQTDIKAWEWEKKQRNREISEV